MRPGEANLKALLADLSRMITQVSLSEQPEPLVDEGLLQAMPRSAIREPPMLPLRSS